MQKKLIALAVASLAAGSVFAQSNVTISGLVAVSYNNYKISDTTRPVATENRLDDQTSRFTLKGTEDLGNGLSAYFQIENRISADSRPNTAFGNAQGLADGETFVGIKHKDIGSLGFGKFAMHYHETLGYTESYRALNTQAYSVDIMGAVGGAFVAMNSRAQNAIKYDTPNWGGFSGKLAYSFNPAGNEGNASYVNSGYATGSFSPALNNQYNKGGAWNIAGRYLNGPINAYASYWDYDTEGAARAGQRSWKVGGDYKFPFGLRVGLHYDDSKLVGATAAADVKRTAWMLPISYTFGANAVYLTYMKANDARLNGVKVADTGAKKWVLAYDYALSKRTFVGASYMNLKNDRFGTYSPWLAGISTLGGTPTGVFAGTVGENARQFSLNMTHFF
ncbi:MAG: porin [Betaproteobacteria bacterium]